MKLRMLARGAAVLLLALALAGAALWLAYGEAAGVLQQLVTATGNDLPPSVGRVQITVDGAATVAHADVYEMREPRAILLLVPGLTPAGRRDSKVVGVAGVLAAAGFRVVVPDLPGATSMVAGEADAVVLATLLDHLIAARGDKGLPLGIVAISYGLGPALAAAADADRAAALDLVVGLGGYHDGKAIVRYATTGSYTDPRDLVPRIGAPDSRARWLLLHATAEHVVSTYDRALLRELARQGLGSNPPGLVAISRVMAQVGPQASSLLALVANTDPGRVDGLLVEIPEGARLALTALSPAARNLEPLAGRLLLVHGEDDPVIPFSESLWLAEAVPDTQVILVPGFSHVEPGETGVPGQIAMIRAVDLLLGLRR